MKLHTHKLGKQSIFLSSRKFSACKSPKLGPTLTRMIIGNHIWAWRKPANSGWRLNSWAESDNKSCCHHSLQLPATQETLWRETFLIWNENYSHIKPSCTICYSSRPQLYICVLLKVSWLLLGLLEVMPNIVVIWLMLKDDERVKAMMQEKKRPSCETEAKLNRSCKLDQTWDIFVTPQTQIINTIGKYLSLKKFGKYICHTKNLYHRFFPALLLKDITDSEIISVCGCYIGAVPWFLLGVGWVAWVLHGVGAIWDGLRLLCRGCYVGDKGGIGIEGLNTYTHR